VLNVVELNVTIAYLAHYAECSSGPNKAILGEIRKLFLIKNKQWYAVLLGCQKLNELSQAKPSQAKPSLT
jgi:hypothetical protein